MKTLSPEELKPLLTDGSEIAFLDVREHGQYGEGHPFFCVPMPYSRIEALARKLLPNRSVRIVLMDNGDGISERAAERLGDAGYSNLSIFDGGAPAWAAAGYTLFKGVNVPSKTFGELLEHSAGTPRLSAEELFALCEQDPSLVILDGRSPDEFQKMSLPGALCCPNAELGYRLRGLVPDDSTTIVINCAGRTRSILGVEGLRLLKVPNPLFALENGTQGWRLAGFDLDHGMPPQPLPLPSTGQLETLEETAQSIIKEYGLQLVSPNTLDEWLNDDMRSTYLLDVRTADEFASAHWPGARHAPGGQLVQATDQFVAVRNARIVLSDDNRLRAATTAIRLQQMGHTVFLLDTDAGAGDASLEHKTGQARSLPELAEHFGKCARDADYILDTSNSMDYRAAHIDGALWVTRARLGGLPCDAHDSLLITGRDPATIDGVAIDLAANGFSRIETCVGSPEIWADAGLKTVSSEDSPPDDDCIDYLFFVHDRHDGNMDAARRYLEWEVGLIDQLDEQERSVMNPHAPAANGGS